MTAMFILSLMILFVCAGVGLLIGTWVENQDPRGSATTARIVKSVAFVWGLCLAGCLIFWQWVIFIVMHFVVKAW